MNLYVDLATRRIVFSPKLNKEIARVDVKRGDVFPLSIVFIRNGKPVQINATPQIEFCAKSKNNLEGLALVYANSFALTNGSTNPSYNGTVAFNSAGLATILNNVTAEEDDLQFIDLHSEISWIDGTQVYTTSNLVLRVYNDVIKGNEVTPTPQPNQPVIFLYGIETPIIEGIDGGSVTVNATLIASHIHGNLAGNVYAHIRASETLAKGDPVYISGFHGSGSTLIAEVSKADASNAYKMPAVGIVDAPITQHQTGHMVITGSITELNTSSFQANQELYVKSGGGFTSTPPTARAQPIGRVERANNNNGAIIVIIGRLSASDATPNTLVRRDNDGSSLFYSLRCTEFEAGNANFQASSLGNITFASGATINFNALNYNYGLNGAATAHRNALNVIEKNISEVYVYDEFLNTTGNGEIGWSLTGTGSSVGSESRHPGIFRLSTTTTGALFLAWNSGLANIDTYNGLTIEGVFRLGSIVNSRVNFGVGFVNTYPGNPFRGLSYNPTDSPNFTLQHRNLSGTTVTVNTNVPAVLNDWIRVKLTYSSGSTTLSISTTSNPTTVTVVNNGSYTPSTGTCAAQWTMQAITGTQTIDIDAFLMYGVTTRL